MLKVRPGIGKRPNPAASTASPASAPAAKQPRVGSAPVVVRPPERPPQPAATSSTAWPRAGLPEPSSSKGGTSRVIPAPKGGGGRSPVAPGSFVRTVASSSSARSATPGARPATPGARPVSAGARSVPAPSNVSSAETTRGAKTLTPTIGRHAGTARPAGGGGARLVQGKPAQPGARSSVIANLLAAKGSGKLGVRPKPVIGAKIAVPALRSGKTPVIVKPPKKVGVKVKPPARTVPAPVKVVASAGKPGTKGGSKGIPCKFFATGACRNGAACPFVHGKAAPGKGYHSGSQLQQSRKSVVPKVVTPPRKVAPPNREGDQSHADEPRQEANQEMAGEDAIEALTEELAHEIRAFLDESGGKADGADVLEKFPGVVKEQLHSDFLVTDDESGNFLVSAVDAEEEPWPEFGDEEPQDGEDEEEREGEEGEEGEEYEMQDYNEEGDENEADNEEEHQEEYETENGVAEGYHAEAEEGHEDLAEEEEPPRVGPDTEVRSPVEADEEYPASAEAEAEPAASCPPSKSNPDGTPTFAAPDTPTRAAPGSLDFAPGTPTRAAPSTPPDVAPGTPPISAPGSSAVSTKVAPTRSSRAIGASIGSRPSASSSLPVQAGKGVSGKASRTKGGMLVLPPARTPPPKPQPQQQEKGGGKGGVACRFFAKGACRNGSSCPYSHAETEE